MGKDFSPLRVPQSGGEMSREIEGQLSWEMAVAVVEKDLQAEFRDSHSPETIGEVARRSVHELASQDVRIRMFVPILARREARRLLKRMQRAS
jgi:hypothetical protein